MKRDLVNCFCGCAFAAPVCAAGDDVDISICPGCGYWRSAYRDTPSRREVQEEHPSAYQGRDGRRFGSLISRLRAGCARYRARYALLSAHGPTQVIDFGCGQGYFLDALRSAGHQCLGIEISETTGRRTMAKGHRVAPTLDALADQSFAAVVSVHVIEHLPDPDQILAALRRVLRPQACFYFEVPNADSWQARLFGRRWLHCEAGLHIHHFTARAMAGLLAAHGYQTERISTYSFEHGLLGWVQSLFNLAFPYNRFFRNVILNRPLADKLRCWPELLLLPAAVAICTPLLIAEALMGRGAVLRVEGHVSGPVDKGS
jgi:SAM-dependent methyltransferase